MLSFILLSPVHRKPLNCEQNCCRENRAAALGWKKRKESRDHVWCQQMWINQEWRTQARGSTLESARWSAWLRFQTIIQCHAVVGALYRARMTNVTSFYPVCGERDACTQNTHHSYFNEPLMVCIYAELKLPPLQTHQLCWREDRLTLSCCLHGYWCWAT